MLKGVDVRFLIFRISAAAPIHTSAQCGVAMEAAAENDIEFVVLDRPNPLGGNKIEGNLAEDGFISFISQFKIPYVHGSPLASLQNSLMVKECLARGQSANLQLLPMEGWKRGMSFEKTGLECDTNISPHVPYKETPAYYVATGVLVNLGDFQKGWIHHTISEVYAAEWIGCPADGRKNE
jgi:uncharacterized protein YbbC (DUF1343 family)